MIMFIKKVKGSVTWMDLRLAMHEANTLSLYHTSRLLTKLIHNLPTYIPW